MLRVTFLRVRLSLGVLGCALLGLSLFNWAQTLRAGASGYTWVGVDERLGAPFIDQAEIWQASASCTRPFFVAAVLRAKAKLKAYYALAPDEVRTWQSRRPAGEGSQSQDQKGLYHPVSQQDAGGRNSAELEYDAVLHVQYAEWYAAVAKLEQQESQWERRLGNVADQRVKLSESARQGFTAYSSRDLAAVSAKADFEKYVLFLLGLGGFPADEEQVIKADCVNIVPVKKIINRASYFKEIWRWPIDHVAAFALGLELVLVGIFFVPITLWIGSGDWQTVRTHIGRIARRLVAEVRSFHRRRSVLQVLATMRAILSRTRAFLAAPRRPGPAV